MSASSSSKQTFAHRFQKAGLRLVGKRPANGWNWTMLPILPVWVFVSFILSSYTIGGLLQLLDWLNVSPENYLRPTVVQTGAALIVYSLTIGIVIGLPYVLKKQKVSWRLIGLQRLPTWSDIGLSLVTYVAYIVVLATVISMIMSWLPNFPFDQVQNVGFQAFGSRADNMLAFLTLVVLSPVAEEVLFRGYLYGKLKTYIPVFLAAIVTSLLFAIVHFQWNVGVDVFILSMFLCGLRSLTGSIWAGILVHMIKNGVAYYLLFISPLLGA